MVKTGDEILFYVNGVDQKGVVTGIEQRIEDDRYQLNVKDVLGNCVVLIEGDDVFQVLQ